MKIYYNPKLKKLARELRNNSTLAEVLLWNQLKARKMKGCQFMRQKPIGHYIFNFFCSKLKLVIEIDGQSMMTKWKTTKSGKKICKSWDCHFCGFTTGM